MAFIKFLSLAFLATSSFADTEYERLSAPRLRNPDASAHHDSTISDIFPSYSKFFKSAAEDPTQVVDLLNDAKNEGGSELAKEKDLLDAVMEAFGALSAEISMSMPLGDIASSAPSSATPATGPPPVTDSPVVTPVAGGGPDSSNSTEAPTDVPIVTPTGPPTLSPTEASPPAESAVIAGEPTVSPVVADPPSPGFEGASDTLSPSTGVAAASNTESPTTSPLTIAPTSNPTSAPATAAPTPNPTASPTEAPTLSPTSPPTSAPTLERCPGITSDERIANILSILDTVADPAQIRDPTLAQGKATEWILAQDEFQACPSNEKLIQRWALAVLYYSTGGDGWFQCSANASSDDNCGNEDPFVLGETRFLSGANECEWAGISCNPLGCVTEIEFEENNLDGTIPTEIALLSDLIIWGMERGFLTSTIPTEISRLTNLIFIDLDYNELTGTLSSELLGLSSLIQLDLNNNQLSGNIDGIDRYPNMEFLQLHDNLFTGTVPESIGSYTSLSAFTLHESNISGAMPSSVCDLLLSAGNGGSLTSLIADCSLPNPGIVCTCCTDCRSPQ